MDHEQLVALRHHLHQHPEVSDHETATAAEIARVLQKEDPDALDTGVGGHGVLACWHGAEPGPTVLFRADLDALPIAETLALPYRSENEGVSHKCGHDGHMTILAGLAGRLTERPPSRGTVALLFQPAEENGAGAARVAADERLRDLAPDRVYALHNVPGFPLGQVLWRRGVFALASTGLIVEMQGATSHAARPERGQAPTLAMVNVIDMLNSMAQFSAAMESVAKVTVVHARLGERRFGTSPAEAAVMATLRTDSEPLLERLTAEAQRRARALGAVYDLQVHTELTEEFPVTQSQDEALETLLTVVRDGGLDSRELATPFPWSEDFGHFTGRYPGALFGLGAGEDQPPLHHPDYDFPDALLERGVELFDAVRRKLNGPSEPAA